MWLIILAINLLSNELVEIGSIDSWYYDSLYDVTVLADGRIVFSDLIMRKVLISEKPYPAKSSGVSEVDIVKCNPGTYVTPTFTAVLDSLIVIGNQGFNPYLRISHNGTCLKNNVAKQFPCMVGVGYKNQLFQLEVTDSVRIVISDYLLEDVTKSSGLKLKKNNAAIRWQNLKMAALENEVFVALPGEAKMTKYEIDQKRFSQVDMPDSFIPFSEDIAAGNEVSEMLRFSKRVVNFASEIVFLDHLNNKLYLSIRKKESSQELYSMDTNTGKWKLVGVYPRPIRFFVNKHKKEIWAVNREDGKVLKLILNR